MMKSFSFESPKAYLLAQYLKNSSQALLRYVIIAQSNPILYHTEANGCIFFATVVCMFSEGNVYLIRLKLNFVLQMYLFEEGSITKLRSRMSSGTDFVILD